MGSWYDLARDIDHLGKHRLALSAQAVSERKEFLENIEDYMAEINVRFFQKELVETSWELVC